MLIMFVSVIYFEKLKNDILHMDIKAAKINAVEAGRML